MATFLTFYSFKGGVGRSMALANIADIFARRGLRVLAIDFDLEAPGLERYFQVERTAALANRGLIDLLQSFKKSLSSSAPLDESAEFRQLERFIFPIYQRPLSNGGELHLITAGQREPAAQYRQYALAVRTFDWQDFYNNWEGQAFFAWLRGQLSQAQASRPAYDVILVDSRTGVTEMGGVCTYLLADAIVMLCAANHQNVEGTREVVRDFRSGEVSDLRKGRALDLVVVPARIEQQDEALLDKFCKRFDSFFVDQEPAAFNEAGLSFLDLTLPYQPEFAFEEIVVSDPERRQERRLIGGAFERLADALTLLASPGDALAARRERALAAIRQSLSGKPAADVPRSTEETHFDPTLRFAGYDAFLSAGAADQEVAQALAKALGTAGLAVLVDSSALTPGNRIAEATTQALHHSRHLLLCAGRGGIAIWQKREIELARSSNQPIRILPVLLPGADQDIFSLSLRGVADLQVLDLRAWSGDGEAPAQLLQLLRSRSSGSAEASTDAAPAENPYPGLDAYGEGTVQLIELPAALLEALASRLRDQGLCLLAGATGVGKGSLVAALIADLRRSGIVPGVPVSILSLQIGQPDFTERLAAAPPDHLLIVNDWDHAAAGLYPPQGDSWLPASLRARIAAASPARPLLLVGHDLPLLAWRQAPSVDASLWERLRELTCILDVPDAATVRRAIEAPAIRSGFAFEPGLLDRIVQDAGAGPGALPLAQMVLTRLWQKSVRGFLTNAAYDDCGGVPRLFAVHLAGHLAQIPVALSDAVNGLLLRLPVVGDDDVIAWQAVVWESIRSQANLAARGAEALLWLMDRRLVNVWRSKPDELQVSLLLAPAAADQGYLAAQVAEHREPLRLRQRLDIGMGRWHARERSPEFLLTGYRLRDAGRLLEQWAEHLSDDEQDYIGRSQQQEQEQQQQAVRLSKRSWRVLVAASVVIACVAAVSFVLYREKDQQARDEERNAALRERNAALAFNAFNANRYSLDASLFKGARIYPQYKDASDNEIMGALDFAMRALGVPMEAAQLVKDAPTCGEVRFFHNADSARADALANASQQVLKTLGYDLETSVLDLSGSRLAKDKPGTIELWLPPLRSLARQSTLPPATNPLDGAELRPVPGSCATLGSTANERQDLASKLEVRYNSLYDEDLPKSHNTWISGFLIYRHEVTSEQFARFTANCRPDMGLICPGNWPPHGKPASKPREPARFLGWAQADAYCRWAGGRLPSEEEWEKAARGTDGRIWPWGNEADATRFQGRERSDGKRIAEVGLLPAGDSFYGVSDMAGNLWELTASPWPGGNTHVMKGGSYLNPLMEVRSAWRWTSANEASGSDYLGFRCVLDLPYRVGERAAAGNPVPR